MPYTGFIAVNVEGEFADIPHMVSMSVEEYTTYLHDYLYWVDHHGVLRDMQAQFPIATSREQLSALIRFLQEEVEPKLEG
jgi:hypothetical protein